MAAAGTPSAQTTVPKVLPQTIASSAPQPGTASAAEAMDWQPTSGNFTPVKQYLWKHPDRAGRITLYGGPGGNKVSFSHLADGTPYEECTPHGSWD